MAASFLEKLGHLASVYPGSLLGGLRHRHALASIETTCLFIGYPRSGHSLVGSLIDAHPEAVIAHEADILKYVFARFSKAQLQYLMLDNSRRYAAAGRTWQGHTYDVPGQWKGRFRRLKVIGDKHGEATLVRLMLVPGLLDWVERSLGPGVRFVHVVRNPFDNIATIWSKGVERFAPGIVRLSGDALQDSVAYYEALSRGVEALRPLIGDRMLDVAHEDLIAKPTEELSRICRHLELEPMPDYLAACAGIVFEKPHKSRHDAPWTPALLARVGEHAQRVPALARYTFSSTP